MKAVILEGKAVNPGDISWEPVINLIETKIYENTTEDNKFDHIGDADIVLSNKVIIDDEVFEKCPNIKYVGLCSTGFNVVDLESARRHNVVVTNVPAYSTDSVAQLAWAMILNATTNLDIHKTSVAEGDWTRSDIFCYWLKPFMELTGKTLGIVGFGNIGRKVAEIAKAFSMNILVYTAHPEKYKDYIISTNTVGTNKYENNSDTSMNKDSSPSLNFVSLDELYKQSDIITLHCPLTPENKEMINKDSISRMKDGAILINVSRGPLLNENDVKSALEAGKLSHVAVDVVSEEPMKEENPLLTAPNITITPHMGWASTEARTRLVSVVADNLKAFMDGAPVNKVN